MMIDATRFKPNTVYVTYIAATPEKVWQALTDPAFTRQYFFGLTVDVEPRAGGVFRLLHPGGQVHVSGRVIEWSPPRRFSCTWRVEGGGFGELPECLVSYDIEPVGEAVCVTMTEAHSWDVPPAILAGGRAGWPKILASLKTLLEMGKPLSIAGSGPPPEMIEAVKKAVAEKPWLGNNA
jgi:uncharacterized protein YndB with AHSA1/START domain